MKPTPVFSSARSGLGALIPGTVKLLSVATADPGGGPAWGLRVLSTTRGAGCVQVGRLVDGKLVALGEDGAFGNDGRAHALPTSVAINSFSCALLDSQGQFFTSVTMLGQTASAAWWYRSTSCVPTGTPRARSSTHPACPLGDERDVYYGLLGPQATSITYTVAGQRHTQATVGPDGAYLIVTDVSAHQRIPGAGGGTADDVPVFSPITSIQYRNGATCHLLTAHKWIVGFHACAPVAEGTPRLRPCDRTDTSAGRGHDSRTRDPHQRAARSRTSNSHRIASRSTRMRRRSGSPHGM